MPKIDNPGTYYRLVIIIVNVETRQAVPSCDFGRVQKYLDFINMSYLYTLCKFLLSICWIFMLKICFLFFDFILVALVTTNSASPDASRLFEDLLGSYNKLSRPVKENDVPVEIQFKLKLLQILDVVGN